MSPVSEICWHLTMDEIRIVSVARLGCPAHSASNSVCDCRWQVEGIPVTPLLQKGPTCGLVALAMAISAFDQPACINPDTTDAAPSHTPNSQHVRPTPIDASETAPQLLKVAQSLQYTWKGEMFSAEWLATIARHQGISATVVEWRNSTQVAQHLLEGGLCLVAYDKDGNHEPCLKRGSKAHWALIHGFVAIQDSGVPGYLLCKHGKSLHQAVWSYNALFESCWNMERVNETVLSQSRGFRNVVTDTSNPALDDDYLELDQSISAANIIDNNEGDGCENVDSSELFMGWEALSASGAALGKQREQFQAQARHVEG
ncbi:hypothetical protein CcCBS67573_g06227 [Chytriomyces confervae]|uniref:Actin maturation protease n=1 Tax=Chytriomyces confervae TaxID=246404 RepID=A0A507F4V5_9FUNG|nr:hypothetical protein CcCBS67573_g06227 [Chytriomyces confervae]